MGEDPMRMVSAPCSMALRARTMESLLYLSLIHISTAHVDHANVLYEVPQKETGLPMVFLHGYGQSRTGWMATPDGKPGWADFFLRHGH